MRRFSLLYSACFGPLGFCSLAGAGTLLFLLIQPGKTEEPTHFTPTLFPKMVDDREQFEKITLTNRYYCDGIHHGDINRDGHEDIIAGPFWYSGPGFKTQHEFYPAEPLEPEPSPSNSMFSFVYDFNSDGWLDILVLGRVHKHSAYWYENPQGKNRLWKKHYAFERVKGESPQLLDMNQDGKPELLAHWEGRWGWIEPNWNSPTQPWTFHAIGDPRDWKQFYHGQGAGDLNGDGLKELITNDGWYEQPSPPNSQSTWNWHPYLFSDDRGGAQIFLNDVDGDGDQDLLTSLNAHEWGLAWFEQQQVGDEPVFIKHQFMGTRKEESHYGLAFSQPHALDQADMDGDGLKDLVVGKRMWAHGPKGDVEPGAAPVLYWFKLKRTPDGKVGYEPHLVDDQSGVGVQVTIADVNQDGRNDILTVSKLGSFVFLNKLSQ